MIKGYPKGASKIEKRKFAQTFALESKGKKAFASTPDGVVTGTIAGCYGRRIVLRHDHNNQKIAYKFKEIAWTRQELETKEELTRQDELEVLLRSEDDSRSGSFDDNSGPETE